VKLFWGKPCPREAVFHCQSFSNEIFFEGVPERVELLPEPRGMRGKKRFLPEKEEWKKRVGKALELIEKGVVEKVVLSRACLVELKESPDPFAIAAALREREERTTVFCLSEGKQAFLGATPERLFSRRRNKIESEALAGTQWGGREFSEKQMRELEPVRQFVCDALAPFCVDPPLFSPVHIHQTNHLRHLRSTCHATLLPGVSDKQLQAVLHPTPALAGSPQPQALALIRQWEERGLYGGFLGWRHRDSSEYVVAIRCCSLAGTMATLRTGVGIVAGSDPDAEWEELNQKLRVYEGVLL